MSALKIEFGGPNNVSIDWNAKTEGLAAAAQKAGVAVMTQRGSDKFIPSRGTTVVASLFSYGIFDLLGMQHTLNFGSLKARRDIQNFETSDLPDDEKVSAIQMSLIRVEGNVAEVSVSVTNQAGEATRNTLEIA